MTSLAALVDLHPGVEAYRTAHSRWAEKWWRQHDFVGQFQLVRSAICYPQLGVGSLFSHLLRLSERGFPDEDAWHEPAIVSVARREGVFSRESTAPATLAAAESDGGVSLLRLSTRMELHRMNIHALRTLPEALKDAMALCLITDTGPIADWIIRGFWRGALSCASKNLRRLAVPAAAVAAAALAGTERAGAELEGLRSGPRHPADRSRILALRHFRRTAPHRGRRAV